MTPRVNKTILLSLTILFIFGFCGNVFAEILPVEPTNERDTLGLTTFKWISNPPANNYIVYVGLAESDGTVTSIVAEKIVYGGLTETNIQINEEGSYKWQVVSLNESGSIMEVGPEAFFSIEVTNSPASLEPSQGATFSTGDEVTFSWEGNSRLGYIFEVDEINLSVRLEDPSYTLKLDLEGGVYRWRVGAIRANGLSIIYSNYIEINVLPQDYVSGQKALAYLVDTDEWTSYILVSNPTFVNGFVNLEFCDANGESFAQYVSELNPYGSIMLSSAVIDREKFPQSGSFSVTIESNIADVKVTSALVSLTGEDQFDLMMSEARNGLNNLVIPEIKLNETNRTYIILRDVSGEGGTTSLSLYSDSGITLAQKNISLSPDGLQFFVPDSDFFGVATENIESGWLNLQGNKISGMVIYQNLTERNSWSNNNIDEPVNGNVHYARLFSESGNQHGDIELHLCNMEIGTQNVTANFYVGASSFERVFELAPRSKKTVLLSESLNDISFSRVALSLSSAGKISSVVELYKNSGQDLVFETPKFADWSFLTSPFVTTEFPYSTDLVLYNTTNRAISFNSYIYDINGSFIEKVSDQIEAHQVVSKNVRDWFTQFVGNGLVRIDVSQTGLVGHTQYTNIMNQRMTVETIAVDNIPDPVISYAYAQKIRVQETGNLQNQIIVGFNRPLQPQSITSQNLDEVLPLNNDHVWGASSQVAWSRFNTIISISLGNDATVQPLDRIGSGGIASDQLSRILGGSALIGGDFLVPPQLVSAELVNGEGSVLGELDSNDVLILNFSEAMDLTTLTETNFTQMIVLSSQHSFGANATAKWSNGNKTYTITLGSNASVFAGDLIFLDTSIKSADGQFIDISARRISGGY